MLKAFLCYKSLICGHSMNKIMYLIASNNHMNLFKNNTIQLQTGLQKQFAKKKFVRQS